MKRVLQKIADAFETISAAILFFMLIMVLLQVLFRFVLKISAPWTEEFARMGFIWLVFLMLPVMESRNDQLKVTYFFDKIPYKARVVVYWIMSLCYVAVLVLMAIGGVRYFLQTKTFVFASVRWLLASYQYIPIVIGSVMAIVYVINNAIHYKDILATAEAEYEVELEEEKQ